MQQACAHLELAASIATKTSSDYRPIWQRMERFRPKSSRKEGFNVAAPDEITQRLSLRA
jgi:hypothetical protein